MTAPHFHPAELYQSSQEERAEAMNNTVLGVLLVGIVLGFCAGAAAVGLFVTVVS